MSNWMKFKEASDAYARGGQGSEHVNFAAKTVDTQHAGDRYSEQNESPRHFAFSTSSFSGILEEDQVDDIIRTAIDGEDCQHCFCGLLFRGKNDHDENVVSHAVEGMTRSEAQKLVSERYYKLPNNHSDLFLAYDRSKNNDPYVIFNFRLPDGYRSLRELLGHKKSRECGEMIFRRLVELLAKYEERTRSAGVYRPLCCISLDTVFIHETNNNIKVVPLVARFPDFPTYYPGEAGTPAADMRTDLFTAALTALQFMSGIEVETGEKAMADCSHIPGMDDCLRLLQSRRPDIRTILALLNRGEGNVREEKTFFTVDGDRKKPAAKPGRLSEIFGKFKRKETSTYSELLEDDD